MEFFLPGAPLPAPRPRFRVIKTRGGQTFVSTYYDKKYKTFLEEAPKAIRLALVQGTHRGVDFPPLDGPLELNVTFYVERPKTTKRDTPRYDIDNYLKGIMDAMTKAGVWNDDDQVAVAYARKCFAPNAASIGAAVRVASIPHA